MNLTNAPMDILARLREGDSSAFNEIFKQFHKAVFYFANKLVENKEEAEDIAQVTFTKLWKHRDQFETVEKLKAFLYITARNRCLDYIKLRKARETDIKTIQYLAQKEWEDTENRIIKADILRSVYYRIELLPKKQKMIFKMLYWENLSFREIGERLNMTPANIRMHKSLAIKNLRALLERSNLLCWLLSFLPAASFTGLLLPF